MILVTLKLLIAKCSFKNFINTAFHFHTQNLTVQIAALLSFYNCDLETLVAKPETEDRLFILISIFQPCIVLLCNVLLRMCCVPEPDPGTASHLREATAAPDGAAARGVLQGQRLNVSSADQLQRPRYEQGAAGQYTLPSFLTAVRVLLYPKGLS